MGIVGPRPETGLRIDLVRPVAGGPPWRYEGTAVTPTAEFRLRAQVTEAGAVAIETAEALPEGLAQKAKLLLRAAWKHADGDDAPPPPDRPLAGVMGLAETHSGGYLRARRPMKFAESRSRPASLAARAGRSAVLVAALALTACEGEPAKTALGYTDSAKHAYDLAMEQFTAHDWLQAENALREVKRKYSYSKYARLAELRLADLDLLQEKYPEAIHGYKDFIHAHRADADDIAYARGKIAEAMCAEIPDSALLPAQEERDQASVVDAYKELKSYIADYPEAKETPHMRVLLSTITARLVRHELYVARFYANLDNFDAAIARIRYALSNYAIGGVVAGEPSDSADLEAEALLLLGETYMRLHKWSDARTAFESILKSYAASSLAVPARNYLASLASRG